MKAAFTPDPDSPDSLAEFVLDTVRAAERAGASAAEAQISTGDGLDVTVRAGACETVQHERDKSLAITVYVDHRKGTATTSDFTAQAIEETIGAALRIARHTEADPHAGPIDASYLSAPEDLPNLALDYPWPLDAEEAIQLALECERAATGHDARIRQSDGCNVTRYRGTHAYANQHGFAGAWTATRHGLSAIMIAADDDGAMQRGYWYTTARDSSTLEDAEAVGRRAAERTAAKLGAAKIPTCECPVLFEAGVSAGLIRHLLAAISGGAQYRRASFLQDALGDAVMANTITLREEPHLPRGLGSAPFDSDGMATSAKDLVKAGVLERYILSAYSARRLGLEPSGNAGGVHNLIASHGSDDLDALIARMDKGILVTDLMGFGVNGVTGDYSRGASGFLIEGGEKIRAVEEITIAGNLKDMLHGIQAVGNDVDRRSNIHAGSILVDSMAIAGT